MNFLRWMYWRARISLQEAYFSTHCECHRWLRTETERATGFCRKCYPRIKREISAAAHHARQQEAHKLIQAYERAEVVNIAASPDAHPCAWRATFADGHQVCFWSVQVCTHSDDGQPVIENQVHIIARKA